MRIEIGSVLKPAENVRLQTFEVTSDKKQELLEHLLKSEEGSFLVFVRTKHGAERVAQRLSRSGHGATQHSWRPHTGAAQRGVEELSRAGTGFWWRPMWPLADSMSTTSRML